jgi:hypothetical protein
MLPPPRVLLLKSQKMNPPIIGKRRRFAKKFAALPRMPVQILRAERRIAKENGEQ